MKPIYLFLFAALIWSSCDKTSETPALPTIPDAVVQSISGKFNQPTDFTITNLQTEGLYAADFQAQNNHYQAIISENGTLLSLEKELPLAAMPVNGVHFITHQYPNSSMVFLYADLDPVSNAPLGYFTKITRAGKGYLLSLDTLGGRISVEEEPDTVWWRYPVRNVDYLQQNIRTEINAAQPLAQFHAASKTISANGQTRWNVSVLKDENLYTFLFDASGNRINPDKQENLLGLDVPGIAVVLEKPLSELPTVCTDYLNSNFNGWQFQRAIFVVNILTMESKYSMIITVNQTVYYIRFGQPGNFTGATRG